MRAEHLFGMILTPVAQAILLLSDGTNPAGSAWTKPLALLALILPIACYVWALRDAPIAPAKSRRFVRYALLGIVGAGLSLSGFVIGLTLITSHAALK